MKQFICGDCGLATAGPTRNLTWCPVLERVTQEEGPCQVSKLGLQRRVRENESLRDEADEISEQINELNDRYSAIDDLWYDRDHLSDAECDRLRNQQRKLVRQTLALEDRRTKLEDEIRPWVAALSHLWSRTKAPNRQCPKCDFIPVDSQVRDCPVHGTPLCLITTS